MGGGNGQKAKTARERNAAKLASAGKGIFQTLALFLHLSSWVTCLQNLTAAARNSFVLACGVPRHDVLVQSPRIIAKVPSACVQLSVNFLAPIP